MSQPFRSHSSTAIHLDLREKPTDEAAQAKRNHYQITFWDNKSTNLHQEVFGSDSL